jgi:hypothetical protein
VLDLTDIYQQVRFGGRPLDEATRRDYALRVRALRHARQQATPSKKAA